MEARLRGCVSAGGRQGGAGTDLPRAAGVVERGCKAVLVYFVFTGKRWVGVGGLAGREGSLVYEASDVRAAVGLVGLSFHEVRVPCEVDVKRRDEEGRWRRGGEVKEAI